MYRINKKNKKFFKAVRVIFSNSLKMACAGNFNASMLFKVSGWKICPVLHCCLNFQKIFATARPLKRRAKPHFVEKLANRA